MTLHTVAALAFSVRGRWNESLRLRFIVWRLKLRYFITVLADTLLGPSFSGQLPGRHSVLEVSVLIHFINQLSLSLIKIKLVSAGIFSATAC